MSRRQFCAATVAGAAMTLAACTVDKSDTSSRVRTWTTPGTPTSSPTPGAQPSSHGPEAYAGLQPTTFGTAMEGITETVPTAAGVRTIALTFDACGGPSGSEVDQQLIDTLREFAVPTTLFLSSRWIEANPEATRSLAADPLFRLENHGTRHLPLSVTGQAAYGIPGTANAAEVIEEIDANREVLANYGVQSTWFRSGTAHYDDVAVRIAADRGVGIAGFTVNGDDGATADAATVAARINAAPDGAIVLAHMNHPGSGTAAGTRQALNALGTDGSVRFSFLDGTGV